MVVDPRTVVCCACTASLFRTMVRASLDRTPSPTAVSRIDWGRAIRQPDDHESSASSIPRSHKSLESCYKPIYRPSFCLYSLIELSSFENRVVCAYYPSCPSVYKCLIWKPRYNEVPAACTSASTCGELPNECTATQAAGRTLITSAMPDLPWQKVAADFWSTIVKCIFW